MKMEKPPSRWSRWFQSLTSTARINPQNYSAQLSPNRFASLGYAVAGWLYMLRWQKNTRIMSIASITVMATGVWLQLSNLEWALIIITITIVWLTEFLNAGIEAAIDTATSEYHPMAKVGKDVASAAVLLGVVASILVGVLVLGPHLLVRLGLG